MKKNGMIKKVIVFFVLAIILVLSISAVYSSNVDNTVTINEEEKKPTAYFYNDGKLVKKIESYKLGNKYVLTINCIVSAKADKIFLGWKVKNSSKNEMVYCNGLDIAINKDVIFEALYENVDETFEEVLIEETK